MVQFGCALILLRVFMRLRLLSAQKDSQRCSEKHNLQERSGNQRLHLP